MTMRNSVEVRKLLKSASKLKRDHLHGQFYITPDKTYNVRKARSKLVAEVRELINSNSNVMISETVCDNGG